MVEVRHLRYFVAVAEELNFTRAAQRVHIDQTPLSRAVRDLEDELDVQLLVRSPKRLQLTPAGARMLQEARKILSRLERAKRVVRCTHALYHVPLRVGVADGIAQPLLSQCLQAWQKTVPEIPLELFEMRARELAFALRTEDVDVGFSFGLPDDDAIAQQPAWRYRVVAMLPSAHELAPRAVVALHELLAFPLLSCDEERQPGLLAQMRAIARRHTVQPTIAGTAYSLEGYVNRIASGAAVGLADYGHAQTIRRRDIVFVPLVQEEFITTFVLHKHQRFGITTAVQRFLTHVSNLS